MTKQQSGFTTNYTDPNSGINLPIAWFQLTSIVYQPYNSVIITYDIYKDFASYDSGKSPFRSSESKQINFPSNDWTNYFDPDFMDAANHNIQKECLGWLQNEI